VVGEEDRVDELGFATRELGDEGHRELVVAQAVEQVLQAHVRLGVAHVVTRQPRAQAGHRVAGVAAPAAVGGKLFGEIGHRRARPAGGGASGAREGKASPARSAEHYSP